MVSKKLKLVVTLCVVAVTLFALFPTSGVQADELTGQVRQEAGTNLLDNPGFEGIGVPPDNALPNPENWTRATFNSTPYGEIFTPEGWVTWWQETDGFKRPECKVIPNEHPFNSDPDRIHEGYYSGMCFAFFGKQNAGYYQVVRNVPSGSLVEGSFYAHAWSCAHDDPPVSCGDPHNFYFRVGIDPNGGTDPFSNSIVWSAPYYNYDNYGLVGPVQATAGEAGAVTIFLQSYAKWSLKHNDAYFDNASLKLVTQAEPPTPTPPPPPPTSEADEAEPTPETPQATPTARADGDIVHVIEEGDTLFGLAVEYGVDVQQIYDLNNLSPDSLLSIGQEVVISTSGDVPAAPEPTAVPEESEPSEPEAEATPSEPAPESDTDSESNAGGSDMPASPSAGDTAVCVAAFYDANSDMFRQPEDGEMLLPNAQISLVGRSGPVADRTTDGISEPWCFEDLSAGNYVLRYTPPEGYQTTDNGSQQSFILNEGQVMETEIGFVRDEAAADPGGTDSEAASQDEVLGEESPADAPAVPDDADVADEDEAGVTNVLNVVLRVSGFIVLALAIAVLVLFVLSRRSV